MKAVVLKQVVVLLASAALLRPGLGIPAEPRHRAQPLLPGVVPQGHVFATAASADGNEIYFCAEFPERGTMEIHVTRRVDGRWTSPKPVAFSGGDWRDIDPFLAPGGQRMIFNSNRPLPDGTPRKDFDLYVSERVGDGWGPAQRMPAHLQSDRNDYFAVTSEAGDLYFASDRAGGKGLSDIWMARKAGDGFLAPANVGEVNSELSESNVALAPDGRFMLVVFSDGGVRSSLRYALRAGGRWQAPQPLSHPDLVDGEVFAPAVSNDGSTLYFTKRPFGGVRSKQVIYSLPIEALEELARRER